MTCCFIGHRKIRKTPELTAEVQNTVKELIDKGVTVFLFGDHSEFDTLCYETVTALKKVYPHICRIHYRTAYREIDESVKQYFVAGYEDSICPKGVAASGKAAYVERNQALIRDSDICLFYYDEHYRPDRRKQYKKALSDYQPKSGTRLAFDYAKSQSKKIINLAVTYKTEPDYIEKNIK